MKFIISSLAAAAIAFVASAAPIETAQVVTTELPARFAMYLVTEEPKTNGLRIAYFNTGLEIRAGYASPNWTPVDGVFLGGRGRIALDRTVHERPSSNTPTNPEPWGDWNVMFFTGVSQISVNSEETQATFDGWNMTFTVGKWVQDSNGILRLLDANGALKENGLRLCSVGGGAYVFWWDDIPYLPCPVAQFKIVPLEADV